MMRNNAYSSAYCTNGEGNDAWHCCFNATSFYSLCFWAYHIPCRPMQVMADIHLHSRSNRPACRSINQVWQRFRCISRFVFRWTQTPAWEPSYPRPVQIHSKLYLECCSTTIVAGGVNNVIVVKSSRAFTRPQYVSRVYARSRSTRWLRSTLYDIESCSHLKESMQLYTVQRFCGTIDVSIWKLTLFL